MIANTAEQSAYMFRLLHALDPKKALEALADALQRRIEEGSESADLKELDKRFGWALETLAESKAGNVSVKEASDLLKKIVEFLQYGSPRPSNSGEGGNIHATLTASAAKWLKKLESAQDVADYLSNLIIPQARHNAGGFVALGLLLQQNTEASLTSIANFISARNSSDVERLLRHLSTSSWPSGMEAQQVANIFFAFERRIPEDLVAPNWLRGSGTTVQNRQNLLEARFVLMLPNSQGRGGFQLADLLLPNANLKTRTDNNPVFPEHWQDNINQIRRNAQRTSGPTGSEALTPLELNLVPPNPSEFWPNLMMRVVDVIADSQSSDLARVKAFVEHVLESGAANRTRVGIETAHRRIGLLALGIATALANSRPSVGLDDLRDSLLQRILNEDDVNSSPILGVALQRLLPGAKPDTCRELAQKARAQETWINAALVTCAAPSGSGPVQFFEAQFFEALAERTDKVKLSELRRLLGFIALSEQRFRIDMSSITTLQDAMPTVLQQILLRAGETNALSGDNLEAIGRIRPVVVGDWSLGEQFDQALGRSNLVPYPAPSDLPSGALPPWAYPDYWKDAPEISANVEINEPRRASRSIPLKLKLNCTTQRDIVLKDIKETLSILTIHEGRVSSQTIEPRYELRLTPSNCTTNVFVLVATNVFVLVESERSTRFQLSAPLRAIDGRFAPSFEALDTVGRLEPGQRVRIRLEAGDNAYFPLELDRARRYSAETYNLQGDTDTVLTLLDRGAKAIAEDDDGGRGSASLLRRGARELSCGVALRATGYRGSKGEFDLLLRDDGPSEAPPDIFITRNERFRVTVPRGRTAARRIRLTAGANIEIRTENLQQDVDSELTMFDSTGCQKLDTDDDGGATPLQPNASRLLFQAPEEGDYLLEISNIGRRDGEMDVIVRSLP